MSRPRFALVLSAALVSLGSTRALAQLPAGNWALRFADEFNETYSGNIMGLDPDKWSPAYPWTRVHNYPAYIRDENILVNTNHNGLLQLWGKRENYGGQPFTSGAVNSNGLLNFKLGYMEARMKLPAFLGAWPAFWGLQDGWPPEIDMMEARFRNDTSLGYGDMYEFVGTYHYTNTSGSHASGGTGFKYTGYNLTNDFHNYGTLWEANKLTWYIDGTSIGSFTASTATIGQMQNMYLLLNLGIGGWPGDPPGWENVNKSFDIDWVRVWQTAGATQTNWTRATNGYTNWDDTTSWSAGTPLLANQTAYFGSVAGLTAAQLDINGTRTVGGIRIQSSASYRLGWEDDQIMLGGVGIASALIDVQLATGSTQGTQTIGARLELASNTRIKNATANTLTLLGEVHGSGSLTLENGKTTFSGQVHHYADTTLVGTADATFTGAFSTPNNTLAVGAAAGANSVFRTNSLATVSVNALRVGDAGGTGLFVQAASTLDVQTGETWLGEGAGSVGTLQQNGGVFTVNNWLAVGRDGGTGTFNLARGTFIKKGVGNLIIGSLGGVGTFNQTGGVLDVQTASTLLGENTGGGTFTLSNGTANVRTLVLSYSGNATGTVHLNGGLMTALRIQRRGAGTAIFNFNGGTLRAGQSTPLFLEGITAANVGAGGAIIDTQAFDITIAQPLVPTAGSTGGLSKFGTGILRLSGANTFVGATNVQAGQLVVANATALGNSEVNALGGTVTFDPALSSVARVKGLNADGTGRIEINGAGVVIAPTSDVLNAFVADLAAGRIVSSLTAGDARIAVGFGTAAGLNVSTWGGWSLDANAIVVDSVLKGDANLSGAVDFDDLLAIAQHYGQASGSVWTEGDSNYNGTVDFDDLLALAQNYSASAAFGTVGDAAFTSSFAADWALAQSLVPEPTALFACLALIGLRRRAKEQPQRAQR